MPRRSNTSIENAARRRRERINVVAGNTGLFLRINRTKRILDDPTVSWIEKYRAKVSLVELAVHAFERAGRGNALPLSNSKVIEKLFNTLNAVRNIRRERERVSRNQNENFKFITHAHLHTATYH